MRARNWQEKNAYTYGLHGTPTTFTLEARLAEIEGGRLTVLKKWLNQKIHRWGRMFTAEHLMQRVTGQALNPEPFLEQLEKKYGELYEL